MRLYRLFCIVILIFYTSICGIAQIVNINKGATFKIRDESQVGVKYYLLKDNKLFSLRYHNGVISFPDALLPKLFNILVSYKMHSFFISNIRINDVYYLNTYYDNRLFNNTVNKKFGGYLKFKYLFRKRYLIDDGSGYVTITPWVDIGKYNIQSE